MVEFSIERLREEFTYNPETGIFIRHKQVQKLSAKPGSPVVHVDRDGYIAICLDRRKLKGHRVAWAMHYGEWPSMQIDHINGVKTDNRIVNLRLADNAQNSANTHMRKRNKSGMKGVTLLPNGRFQAQITVRGKLYYLGAFDNKEAAGAAYAKAALAHFGEYSIFARPEYQEKESAA